MTRTSIGGWALAAMLIGLLPGEAGAQGAAARDAGQIVYLGDSRVASQFMDPAQRIATARFFGNVAAQLTGRRLRTAANFGVSGQRSDEFLTERTVDGAIATPALWVAVFGVVNDIAQRGPGDYFNGYAGGPPGGIRARIDRLVAAGLRPILVLEPGAAAFAEDAERMESVITYNEAVRRYAADHPQVVVFDLPASTTDGGRVGAFRPGMATDGVHLDNLGSFSAGRAFAELMDPLLPAGAEPLASPGLVSPDAFATSQPAQGPAVRGTVPAGYVVRCDPGLEAVVDTTPAPGDGGAVTLRVHATGPGTCSLGLDLTGEQAGGTYREAVRAEVAAGASGLSGPYLQLQARRGGSSLDAFDNYGGVAGPGPSDARTLDLLTPPLTIPDGEREWFTTRLGLHFAQGGAGSVSFSRHRVAQEASP